MKSIFNFSKTQIIMLTAGVDDEDDKLAIESFGIKKMLIKPLDIDELIKVLRTLDTIEREN
jgi:DNA-binding response OmpR family regulator